MADVFTKNERMKKRDGGPNAEAYRAFRQIIQKAIFDDKNYDVSIVETQIALGLHKKK